MTSAPAVRNVASEWEKGRENGYRMAEVPPPPAAVSWRTSSSSGGGECVQVTPTQEHVWVRDSKNSLGPALRLTREGWSAFLVGVRREEFVLLRGAGLIMAREPVMIT